MVPGAASGMANVAAAEAYPAFVMGGPQLRAGRNLPPSIFVQL